MSSTNISPVQVTPGTNSVRESAVIGAPLAKVWHLIKLGQFAAFWKILKTAEKVEGASDEADVYRWTFIDGSVYDVKQEEHSSLNHYVTYSIIDAKPDLPYSSATATIRCYPVTSGKMADSTFVEWTTNFSNDADMAVVEDAKFKRRDALADLASAVGEK